MHKKKIKKIKNKIKLVPISVEKYVLSGRFGATVLPSDLLHFQ
jgi:hypothetical protein